ncbi:sugar phosphate isomerase/epimerase family protein [Leucobacter luti]|uniref:Sugar phosphate isomerase/epimerase n=1 Tax=Leucobacter luti TaxID=340320 RepID=A0A4Q7U715_9MICO|nr:sugar phosphate isomerase/epimerase [Leucobacter luti]MBL3700775.1 sugar phosphate isomerase/epimerase [Leucobacter luti]RZT68388.1 sugar phosphate isomerase/epimerase [Leucobacter luti]
MRTSFHTGFLTGVPVIEAVQRIRDAGFDGVELNAERLPWAEPHLTPDTPHSVIERLAATESITSIAAHREGLAHPDPARRAAAVAWTLDLARISVDLGAPLIHVIPGDEPGDSLLGVAGTPGELPAFIDSLRRVVEGAEALGVAVGLEPIVRQLVATTDAALGVLSEVPGLGISLDPSHLEVTTHDVSDASRRLGDRTILFALKDAQGTPENFTFPGLGSGNVDFVGALRILRGLGFDGPVVVEHEAHVFGDARGIDEVLAQSAAFTAQVLAQIEA